MSLAVAGTVIAIAAGSSGAQQKPPPSATPPAGLPDLVMQPISQIKVYPWYTRQGKKVKRRWGVRFTSTVANKGLGHFVIHAHRARTGQPCKPDDPGISGPHACEKGNMTGDQLVVNADGSTAATYKNVAVVYFDEYHFHWHLRGANRYELRTLKGKLISHDNKTGFCFGDRLSLTDPVSPEYPGLGNGLATCLYGSTGDPAQDGRRALELTEGISVGYADDYRSFHNGAPLEGQELELTKLKPGVYQLINRTNAAGRYREVSKANDAASVLFKLSWPRGRRQAPKLKVLRRCPGQARCLPGR
jgi:hypothetical protein